jgi:hypothetical protein
LGVAELNWPYASSVDAIEDMVGLLEKLADDDLVVYEVNALPLAYVKDGFRRLCQERRLRARRILAPRPKP